MPLIREVAPLTLPAAADSPARARAFLRAVLRGGDDDLLPRAELCLTELVTNAVLHAASEVTVDIVLSDGEIRLDVGDSSPVSPRLVPHSRQAVTGRGLGLVTALSASWGVDTRTGGGKVVWCVLTTSATEPDFDEEAILAAWDDLDAFDDDVDAFDDGLETAAHATVPRQSDGREPAPSDAPIAMVHLLGYPVRRGMRLREHREAVRRECQLLLLASEHDRRALPGRLVQLSDHLATQYGAQLSYPEQRKIEAHLRGEDVVDLAYPMVPETLSVTTAWRQLLADIDRYCTEEGLLTLATPPELVELTGWLLDEFTRQVQGRPPRPWPGPVALARSGRLSSALDDRHAGRQLPGSTSSTRTTPSR